MLGVEKLVKVKKSDTVSEQIDIMNVYLYDAADKIGKMGRDALNSFAEGDELKMMHMGMKRFTKQDTFNVKEARQRIAEHLIAEGRYCY